MTTLTLHPGRLTLVEPPTRRGRLDHLRLMTIAAFWDSASCSGGLTCPTFSIS